MLDTVKACVNDEKASINQNLDTQCEVARSIRLYGDYKVVFGIHHVFVVVEYDLYYRLLEVIDESKVIRINDKKGSSINDLISGRSEAKQWGQSEFVNCYDSIINDVIKDYNGRRYIIWAPFGITKNCRTFVNQLLRACGSTRTADDTGFGKIIGFE